MKKINKENLFESFDHFVDSHHGIYSGQIFAEKLNEEFKNGKIEGMASDDWQSLLNGPDDEFYIESWGMIDNIEITDLSGAKYMVYQNEGIFLYPSEIHSLIDWDKLF